MEYNTFFTLYWILTGFHFLHVLLGMVILGWLAARCRRGAYSPANHSGLESGVLYWQTVGQSSVSRTPSTSTSGQASSSRRHARGA